MSFSQKVGEWSGKVVKSTTTAPRKTSSWVKEFGQEVAEGYRSVVPKVEKTEETTEQ